MRGSTFLVSVLATMVTASCTKTSNQAYTTPDTKAKAAAYIADPTKLSEKEITQRASDAYVFGYPLVLMDETRRTMTSERDAARGRGAMNQLTHTRELPDAEYEDVVAPNVDTLYSTAWLDLSEEPVVVTVPNTGDRYYVMQILDAWTNVVDAPGTRTTGSDDLKFAVVGPGYEGRIPRGLKRIDSPTKIAWLIGRVHAQGEDDLAAVHAIQDAMQLHPLSVHEGKAAPQPEQLGKQEGSGETGETGATPPERVAAMDSQAFFARLNKLMADNPPTLEDAAAMARFETLGISPGKPFNLNRLPREVASAIDAGGEKGEERVSKLAAEPLGKEKNGWVMPESTGDYGTDYEKRAATARVGLGANLPEDAVYPFALRDAKGEPLDGSNRYVLHFDADELPEVKAFWSLTAYDSDGHLAETDQGRPSVGNDDELEKNADGSITLYLQSESPGKDKAANWLPIPDEKFNVILRLYWPAQEIIDGEWTPPPIERVRG